MYRPLSPHILIYKPQLNSILSVFHRITGSILTISILVFFIITLIVGHFANYYPVYVLLHALHNNLSWFFIAILILILLSFFYHISNGIRHIIWDFSTQHFLSKSQIKISAYIVLFFALTSTSFFIFFLS